LEQKLFIQIKTKSQLSNKELVYALKKVSENIIMNCTGSKIAEIGKMKRLQ
jgi:hypothetical protein